tara:strand:- start:170 stop:577 length:408 start_codon:yes stop_codon:yes gene_type:complete
MSGVKEMLETMRERRARTLEQVVSVAEEQMLAPAKYGDRDVNVRFMFYRLITHQIEHTIHLTKTLNALGITQGEAGLILKSLQVASGELEGLMVGLTDEDLDRSPGEGDWSLREVLEHILSAEKSYSSQIDEALV